MYRKDLLVRMLDRGDTLPPDEVALIEALPVRPAATLQELRAKDLVSWKDRRIVILDFQRLALLADFDPTYLNLFHEPR
jgi:hypothetical protein